MGLFGSIGKVIKGAGKIASNVFKAASPLIPGATLGLKAFETFSNYAQEQNQQKYQRGLQQDIFNREDNAVQRRTQDLIAAGMNPVLAAGGAAGAGSPVQSQAPQFDFGDKLTDPMLALTMLRAKKDIAATDAQIKYTESQASKTDAERQFTELKTDETRNYLNEWKRNMSLVDPLERSDRNNIEDRILGILNRFSKFGNEKSASVNAKDALQQLRDLFKQPEKKANVYTSAANPTIEKLNKVKIQTMTNEQALKKIREIDEEYRSYYKYRNVNKGLKG